MRFRPYNETEEDLRREREAADIIARAFKSTVEKLSPTLYHVDWCFRRGTKIFAVGEYKHRDVGPFDEIFLSYAKLTKLVNMARDLDVKAFVFFEFKTKPGEIWYLDLLRLMEKQDVEVKWGGNNRNQNGDKEPVAMLPFSEMSAIRYEPITAREEPS